MGNGCAWHAQHAKFLAQHGVTSAGTSPSEPLSASPWWPLLPHREQAVLNFYLQKVPDACSIDTSQSIDRVGCGKHGMLRTLLSKSKPWLVDRHRPLLGREALCAQGFPMELLADARFPSDCQARDLAGNMFSAPVVMAVLCGVLCHFHELQ